MMAKITNHDGSYSARSASEPNPRTLQRVAGRGPLSSTTPGNPTWYNDDTTLLSKTINRTGSPEKRRAGR
jgi:hypothetical protein